MKNFNLIDSPWIPVRNLDGLNRLVSLDTLFREATIIADLDCPPHERISLMRLLVCITQAELGAPDSPDDWDSFGHDLETRVPAYLHRPEIYPHFNLFGEGPRFLQVPIPSNPEPVPASKLIPHLATGNNPTVLDHEGRTEGRSLSPERLATALITFQCFYPLYGAGYKGKGPCVDGNMLHTLITEDTLKETILSNCLTLDWIQTYFPKHKLGRPIWELDPESKEYVETASHTYLGRQVPRHRNLWLLENGTGFLLESKGIEYPRYEEAREPSATVIVIKKKETEERRLLPARLDKSVWRDLHALTVLRQSTKEEARAPLTLHIQRQRGKENISIWTGGLVTDLKAKIYDTIESSFTIPVTMFTETGRARYRSGIDFADKQSNQLYGAVKQYGAAMKNENPPTDPAKQHYWNTLEQQCHLLLDTVRQNKPMTEDFGEGKDPWTQAVRQAALAAYQQICPRQTPHQLQAYAAGLQVLPVKSASKKKSIHIPTAAPKV
jgi:CRISPR system Cascade subunit CasA